MIRIMILVSAFLLLAPKFSAAQEEIFAYKNDNGTLCFTDSLESVPKNYKSVAHEISVVSIWDYHRTTIVQVSRKHVAVPVEAEEDLPTQGEEELPTPKTKIEVYKDYRCAQSVGLDRYPFLPECE